MMQADVQPPAAAQGVAAIDGRNASFIPVTGV
jgi:hypothetical protein